VQRNVVKEVASLKGVSVETLEEQLSANRGRWFGESRTFRLWWVFVCGDRETDSKRKLMKP